MYQVYHHVSPRYAESKDILSTYWYQHVCIRIPICRANIHLTGQGYRRSQGRLAQCRSSCCVDGLFPCSQPIERGKTQRERLSNGRQLEASDRHSMCTELQKYSHPLTSSSNHLYNTITGQVAAADINKNQADELGTTVQSDFITSYPGGIHNTMQISQLLYRSWDQSSLHNLTQIYS